MGKVRRLGAFDERMMERDVLQAVAHVRDGHKRDIEPHT